MDIETKKELKRNAPIIIDIIVCVGLYFVILAIYVINYKVPETIRTNPNISIWNEIATFHSILPIVCPFIANHLIAKISPNYPKMFRCIWSVCFAVLIIIYRVAYILNFDIILLSIVGITHFFVTVLLTLTLDKFHTHKIKIPEKILENALGKCIKNRNILSVQLFNCERNTATGGMVSFRIESNGSVVSNKNDDVNSILKLNLEFPLEDYNQFIVSLEAYNLLVENGADEEGKKTFQEGIQKKKKDLVKRLNGVPLDNLNKTDSCLARLLVCYNMLEKMVDEPSQVTVDFEDGELGLEANHEKHLFSILRTGMLGAILFGSDRRYYFRYRRDGIKIGRKYCAFLINTEGGNEDRSDMHICLVTIRENSAKQISADIIEWISLAEKKIINEYAKVTKEAD